MQNTEERTNQYDMDLERIEAALSQKIDDLLKEGDCCVAFSAGVDSTVVLKEACEQARKRKRTIYAVTFHTMLHPKADMELAMKLAKEYGAEGKVLEVNEFEIPQILDNPPDRCFYCKDYLFKTLTDFAKAQGCKYVLDGTNADDKKVFRPGLKALQKNGVISPLAECGITKQQVRKLAAKKGLATASKPSAPCLATRLPYGAHLDRGQLEKIQEGEAYLKELGFQTLRLRLHDTITRIEIEPEQFALFLQQREKITACLKKLGFQYITLDLEGIRSGSMDEVLSDKFKESLMP